MAKIKIKDKVAMRIRKRLRKWANKKARGWWWRSGVQLMPLFLFLTFSGCATCPPTTTLSINTIVPKHELHLRPNPFFTPPRDMVLVNANSAVEEILK